MSEERDRDLTSRIISRVERYDDSLALFEGWFILRCSRFYERSDPVLRVRTASESTFLEVGLDGLRNRAEKLFWINLVASDDDSCILGYINGLVVIFDCERGDKEKRELEFEGINSQ